MADLNEALNLEFEWEPAPNVQPDEFSVTWARLTITVGSRTVTQVEDSRSHSTRRAVHVPLYPLAEWVAFNWWNLRANARTLTSYHLPGVGRIAGHDMRHVGDGYPWPNLVLGPHGEQTSARWFADVDDREHSRIRYLSSGMEILGRDDTFERLAEFVDAVVARLDSEGVGGTALATEWNELRSTEDDEAEFCEAAARLGLDPYGTTPEMAESIINGSSQLETPLFEELIDAVPPAALDSSVDWVLDALGRKTEGATASDLRPLPHLDPYAATGAPWQVGYRAAVRFRQELDLGSSDRAEPHEFVLVSHTNSAGPAISGLGQGGGQRFPELTIPERPANSERFAVARALWRFAAGTQRSFLLTKAHQPVQQVSRAFAAEFLAPAAGIREFLAADPDEFVDFDTMTAIGDHFGVHTQVVAHQIENQLGRPLDVG